MRSRPHSGTLGCTRAYTRGNMGMPRTLWSAWRTTHRTLGTGRTTKSRRFSARWRRKWRGARTASTTRPRTVPRACATRSRRPARRLRRRWRRPSVRIRLPTPSRRMRRQSSRSPMIGLRPPRRMATKRTPTAPLRPAVPQILARSLTASIWRARRALLRPSPWSPFARSAVLSQLPVSCVASHPAAFGTRLLCSGSSTIGRYPLGSMTAVSIC
mmetsp:Transcript_149182/g.387932  ORF Transcript_149182/g.387932 Transcript_149182/m.387932 type:complete len:214 (-) Transcript_149182:241-882(-)